MIAVILADRAPEARAEPVSRPQQPQALVAAPPAYQLPRQRLANPSDTRGAMFIARGIDAPQMLRDVESARSVGARMTCEHADCRNFPPRLI